ncbi:MAG TPA: Lrp/AsnC ligand binding domain-containing protein [Streptosporangiaceae bacterium]|nr:Lrp/AsnC ligand binding domain-containing protein [Streptosporangiaceae bacterium]
MTRGTAYGDAGQHGVALHALVRIQMMAGADPDDFESRLRGGPGVAEAWRLAGDDDFEVRLSCRSLADLDDMVAQLREAGGKTSTTLVLHRVLLDGR